MKVLEALPFLFFWSFSSYGGHEHGNSGHVVFCESEYELMDNQSYQVLDVYETRLADYEIDFPPVSGHVAKALALVDRLSGVDWYRAELLKRFVDHFESESKIESNLFLPKLPDQGVVQLPGPDCTIKQVAFQMSPLEPTDPRYHVKKEIWDQLDENNRSALILHEVIYRDGVQNGHKTSIPTRRFVREVLANRIQGVAFMEYFSLVEKRLAFPVSFEIIPSRSTTPLAVRRDTFLDDGLKKIREKISSFKNQLRERPPISDRIRRFFASWELDTYMFYYRELFPVRLESYFSQVMGLQQSGFNENLNVFRSENGWFSIYFASHETPIANYISGDIPTLEQRIEQEVASSRVDEWRLINLHAIAPQSLWLGASSTETCSIFGTAPVTQLSFAKKRGNIEYQPSLIRMEKGGYTAPNGVRHPHPRLILDCFAGARKMVVQTMEQVSFRDLDSFFEGIDPHFLHGDPMSFVLAEKKTFRRAGTGYTCPKGSLVRMKNQTFFGCTDPKSFRGTEPFGKSVTSCDSMTVAVDDDQSTELSHFEYDLFGNPRSFEAKDPGVTYSFFGCDGERVKSLPQSFTGRVYVGASERFRRSSRLWSLPLDLEKLKFSAVLTRPFTITDRRSGEPIKLCKPGWRIVYISTSDQMRSDNVFADCGPQTKDGVKTAKGGSLGLPYSPLTLESLFSAHAPR